MTDSEKTTEEIALHRETREMRRGFAMSSGGILPSNFAEMMDFSKMVAGSRITPKQFQGDAGSVFLAIQLGSELGLGPMAALQNIAVINGRPSVYGDGFWAVILGHPQLEDVKESFDEKTQTASCTLKRVGRDAVTVTFSKADADKAGLWDKQGPWKQYPKRMLAWRARGFVGRDVFADALSGVIIEQEARDIVDAEYTEQPAEPRTGKQSFGRRRVREERAKQEAQPVEADEFVEAQEWDDVGPAALTPEEQAELHETGES